MSGLAELSREELQKLLEIAGDLSTEVDQERLVKSILQTACSMTHSPDGSVLLYDPLHQGLFFAAALGPKGPELMQKWGEQSSQRVPLESSAGRAFLSGEVVVEPQAEKDAEHYKGVDEQTGATSRSIVSVPLRVGRQSIGVLQALNKTSAEGKLVPYDAHDCHLLLQLGHMAAAAINHTRLLRKLTAQMGLYSQNISADFLQRIDEPARREQVTVLFADMRGFTKLCQRQAADPEQTQQIMNELFTMYADRVLSRGGILNKFIGDAVLGMFQGEDAARRALRCAFDMLERFDSLRRRWADSCNEDVGFLDLGVGISTGKVAMGSFGTGMVRDFTVLGTTVNLAHALVFAARGGKRVLIDNATWQGVRDIVEEHDEPVPFTVEKEGETLAAYRHFHVKRLTPDRPVRVFISHSHRDREFVESCITGPLQRYGMNTWYSNADIIPGERYKERIQDGLLKCDWVVVLVTDNSVQYSDWVKVEVGTAMSDPRFDRRVLPIQKGAALAAQITPALGELQSINATNIPDLGEYLHNFLMQREVELRMAARQG